MIQLTEIKHEHRLDCPNCGYARLVVENKSVVVPNGRYWLSDGDTIFGLYQDLVDAGLEKAIATDEPSAWDKVNYDYQLLVGDCPSCSEEYYVLQVSMIDDAIQVDSEFVESYFRENVSVPPPTNFVANLSESNLEWLVHRYDTPKGVSLTHIIGPFDLGGKTMRGPYGVSACSSGSRDIWIAGKKLVFELWPQLKTLSRAVNQDSAQVR